MIRFTGVRLTAAYVGSFALAIVALGLVTLFSTRAALNDQFEKRIRTQLTVLQDDYKQQGIAGIVDEIREHDDHPGDLSYGLEANGRPVAGSLAGLHPSSGWSSRRAASGPELRIMAADLPSGFRVAVGDTWDRIAELDRHVMVNFSSAFAVLLAIGVAGGIGFSRALHRRMSAISGTAKAIMDGDLGRRIPVEGGDDLSRLAATLNEMLDRTSQLMDSLRQASSDVAHDLRTPLTRHRQRLELSASQAADPASRAEIEAAITDVDSILETFSALLRIAEMDAGARRSNFRRLDLDAATHAVAEDFLPVAEDGGRQLIVADCGPSWIEGDPDLITQLIVNLVENALRHTPAGSRVRLSVTEADDGVTLTIEDNGLGVPASERNRLFDRFYRCEQSRSTPGSGLGLSLVAAVVRLHRASVRLDDADPGLVVHVLFPKEKPVDPF